MSTMNISDIMTTVGVWDRRLLYQLQPFSLLHGLLINIMVIASNIILLALCFVLFIVCLLCHLLCFVYF